MKLYACTSSGWVEGKSCNLFNFVRKRLAYAFVKWIALVLLDMHRLIRHFINELGNSIPICETHLIILIFAFDNGELLRRLWLLFLQKSD